MRDLSLLPVAYILPDRLLQRALLLGTLALDDDEGDPVDEADDIGTPRLMASCHLHLVFRRDVEGVISGVLPVDVTKGESLRLPVDGLIETLPEGQQVIDLLARANEALEGDIAQCLDRLGDVLLGEGHLAPLEADLIQPAKLLGQRLLQQDSSHLPLPLDGNFFGAEIAVSQLLERPQRGDLADMGFLEGGDHFKVSLQQ